MMDNTFIIVIITFIKLRINVLGIWEVGWVGSGQYDGSISYSILSLTFIYDISFDKATLDKAFYFISLLLHCYQI